MRYFNIIIYLLLFTISKSQNLVNNPSFENISSCPNAASQLTLSTGWINPTQAGNADLFSTCGSGFVSLPNGSTYYQLPRTGNNIAGIFCYSSPTSNGREYIQTQLTSPLNASNNYLIKFYVNSINLTRFATNNIGALLTVNQITMTGASNYIIYNTNSIKTFNNPIIKDTLNWIEISAIYQANGGENYLTIGNFNNDSETDTTTFCHSCAQPSSYYFIDDVSIENITIPQWQYRDTTVVLGDSVLIGPAIAGLNIDWFTMTSTFIKNAPGIYVKPTLTTSYQATETFNGVAYNHTVTVTVLITKVDEYDKLQNSVKLFPNPTTHNFIISNLTESSKLKVEITDTQGKLYSTELITITNNKATIKTNLPNGVYFVYITDTVSGLAVVKKLIVQK